jgi:fluoroacetyl-CoA thioesterase
MQQIFKVGDKKRNVYQIQSEDFAIFNGELVHPVCSTFVLAREIEWATRQFVLECKEDEEEGIGTLLEIIHLGPAFAGEELIIISEISSIENFEIICNFEAKVGDRLIAKGRTGQKVLPKVKISQVFEKMRSIK